MSDFGSEQNLGGGSPAAPAGWYPVDGTQQRYWDGAQWTDHTAPLSPQPGFAPPGDGSPFEPMPFGSPGPAGGAVSADDRTMATLIHVLAIFTGFLAPLIIWLVKRDQSPFVDHHGKEALNFQITLFVAWIATFIAMIVLIGLLFVPVLLLVGLILPILAAAAANRGEYYRYPLSIRLIS